MSPSRKTRLSKSFPRLPYLSWSENPATTITIRYGTPKEDCERIYFEDEDGFKCHVDSNAGKEKEVILRSLKPDTLYRYRIGEQGDEYHFHTAPAVTKPFSFAVLGDYAQKGNRKVNLCLYEEVRREKPAFVLFTGDLVSNGRRPIAWKSQFFSHIEKMSPCTPLIPVPGNHDGKGPLFRYYFSCPDKRRWYHFIYTNALFIGLDTQSRFTPGSPQYSFVQKALQEAECDWKMVFLHKPPYSTNSGHHSDLKVRAALCPLFEEYGVDVVFSGHNHAYERTRPIRRNRVDWEKGVTYVTTGGGGAILKPFIPLKHLTRSEKQWCLIRKVAHHYLQVWVENRTLVVRAKNQWGKIIDHFERSK